VRSRLRALHGIQPADQLAKLVRFSVSRLPRSRIDHEVRIQKQRGVSGTPNVRARVGIAARGDCRGQHHQVPGSDPASRELPEDLPRSGTDEHQQRTVVAGGPGRPVVTAYLLLFGGGLLLGGRIADLVPRHRVFLTGMTIFTTASLFSGFANNAAELIAARATQGLGAALMTPAALSLVMTTYSGAQRTVGYRRTGCSAGTGPLS
jgi:hypothetical protein